jgi:hypothetical protein
MAKKKKTETEKKKTKTKTNTKTAQTRVSAKSIKQKSLARATAKTDAKVSKSVTHARTARGGGR